MALTEPRAGLRRPGVRLVNRTGDVAKVALVVPAGAQLEVDDADVAGQLLRSGSFAVLDAQADEAEVELTAAPVVEEAGGGTARRRSGRRG